MSDTHPGQDPATVLKPLHPRAARPALERVLAQGQVQPIESETLAQIYSAVLAAPGPELPAETRTLIQRFAQQPAERELILERLFASIGKR
ncbi:MAG: hypothetical protein ACAI44_34470 [Candidatus Sericytochromatia bacterium]